MSRAATNKLYTNFSKGLVTEVSPLAYPENASIDEDNCEILSNGDRVRRFGFDRITTVDALPTKMITTTVANDRRIHSHVWTTVDNNPDLDFLVVFINGTIYFYEITGVGDELPAYTEKAFTIDLSSYKLSTATASDVDNSHVSFASGKGELFIVNKYIEPLRVQFFDGEEETFVVSTITIKVRDHYGIEDGLGVEEEPTTLSAEHHYNLLNQGWLFPGGTSSSGSAGADPLITPPGQLGRRFTQRDYLTYDYVPVFNVDGTTPSNAGPIQQYFTAIGRYPSNAKVWWAGKDAEGNFDPQLLLKTFFGNTRAARGHFVINAFAKNRSEVSTIAGLDTETINTRPEAICFTSGRVFFGHESTVYMSPVLETTDRVGQCYQEADPTSEDISDLIPTDGGFIEIPDADHILSLKPLADGIVVLARNGVWFINSGGQGFTAIDYTINKVSDIGIQARESAVIAGEMLFWWTKQGIQVITPATGQFGAIPGKFQQQNITEQTIKTFYNEINEFTRDSVKGAYDPSSNAVYWLYKNEANTRERKILKFDLRFNAFIPSTITGTTVVPMDLFIGQYYVKNAQYPTFLTFLGIQKRWNSPSQSYRDFLCNCQFVERRYVDGKDGFDNHRGTIGGEFPDPDYIKDNYESYIESGYEVMEDGLRKKQTPFLGVFFKKQFNLSGVSSSCFMLVKWSWSNNESSNKWHGPIQVYRPRTTPALASLDEDYYDVIYSRNKVRGSGRAIQFRFYENRENYAFRLTGWHAFYQGNTVP